MEKNPGYRKWGLNLPSGRVSERIFTNPNKQATTEKGFEHHLCTFPYIIQKFSLIQT